MGQHTLKTFCYTFLMKKSQKEYVYKIMKSPVGVLKLVGSEDGLAAILWQNEKPNRVMLNIVGENKKLPILVETEKQLKEYFAKKRTKFDLKLDFNGTDFQKKVWKVLLNIPFGKTVSYADVAKKVGSPNAIRAVGSANGKNPICIVAACHRVIGSTGKLAGYAGGLENKATLLTLEGAKFTS